MPWDLAIAWVSVGAVNFVLAIMHSYFCEDNGPPLLDFADAIILLFGVIVYSLLGPVSLLVWIGDES